MLRGSRPRHGRSAPHREETLRVLLSRLPIAIFEVDRRGVLRLYEGLASFLPGLTPGEAAGRAVEELYREQPLVADAVRQALGGARERAERESTVKSELNIELVRRCRDPAAPEVRSSVEAIARSAGRMLELVESLLEHARIESGRLATSLATFDLGAVAADVVDEMRERAGRKGLELRLARGSDLPPITSDARLVRIVLVNLIGNALKFTDRGAIEAAVSWTGERHELAVTDTGPEIPAERLADIFDPFVQLESVRQKHASGFGLGLALVRSIVQALGGSIRAESELGRGSTFTVVLPSREPGPPAPPGPGA